MQKGLTLGAFSILFLLAFLLSPHITFASGLTRTPSNLGLVGYWSFNEGTSTSVTDFSGNGHEGTFVSMVSQGSWVSGKNGKALTFNGGYVNIPDTNGILNISSNITISFWLKLNSYQNGDILSKNGSGGYVFWLWDSAGQIWFGPQAAGPGNDWAKAPLPPIGQWVHVIGISDGTNRKIYFDGVLQDSQVYSNVFSNSGPLTVGAGVGSGDDGSVQANIDELRIYNRVLSDSEILNVYRSGVSVKKGVSNSGLAGYWPLNEGFGTADGSVIGDVSGNNNYGTTTSFANPSTASSGWSKGRNGYILNFDGVDDRIRITDSSTLAMGAATTFAAWIKLAEYPPASKQYIFQILGDESSGAGNCGSTIWRIGSQGSALYQKRIGINFRTPTDHDDQNNTDLPLNTWTHIAVTTDGTNARYYINGALDTTNTYTITPQNTTCSWGIGWNSDVGRYFKGSISDVRLYNRTLSSDEIFALAKQNTARVNVTDTTSVTDGLLANWTFDGKYMDWTTNNALDSGPNGYNAQMVNISTSTSPVVGKRGQAIRFTSVNDYALAPSISLDSRSFTLAAWMKRNGLGIWYIAVAQGAGVSNQGLHFGIRNSNVPTCAFYGNDLDASTAITDSEWHHVVCVVNRTGTNTNQRTIYIDGVANATDGVFVNDYTGTGNVYIGYTPFIGFTSSPTWLDDVRIYSRALSSTEVKQLYNSGK